MSCDDAIAYYHDLLTPDVAAASWEALDAGMRARALAFGARPICSVLRPYLVSPADEAMLASAAGLVVSALHAAFERLGVDDYEPVLGLSPQEAALARIDGGFRPSETVARLDSFWPRGGELKFIEYNSESPGGIGFGRALADIFESLPVVRAFARRYAMRSEPVLDHTLDALLAAYRAWGGTAVRPAVAIVDWRGARTYTEFVLCKEAFEARGHSTTIADPDELEIAGERLYAAGNPVDIVYRRVVASEVAARLSLDHPLVRAAREGAACVASSFRAFALLSKTTFALVSDPARSHFLSPAQRAAVDAHVPWTRVVRDGRTTTWTGESVDLLEFVSANRERLVVKPATEYGGSNVHLGWLEGATEWEAALRRALYRPSVVQRRVAIPSEPFPVMANGAVRMTSFMADIDPYVFAGSVGKGQGTRLATSDLLNVSAGGGSAAPVFVVEPRT